MSRLNSLQVDNDFLKEKVAVRLRALPDKDEVTVLDCFAGMGILWSIVGGLTDKKISIIRIEKQKNKCPYPHLRGDNLKFLPSMDLKKFDIIDLDAYGIPFDQLEFILNSDFEGVLCVTAITTHLRSLPHGMLRELGYTDEMIHKSSVLCSLGTLKKIRRYLAQKGVREISGFFNLSSGKKNYFYINSCPGNSSIGLSL